MIIVIMTPNAAPVDSSWQRRWRVRRCLLGSKVATFVLAASPPPLPSERGSE